LPELLEDVEKILQETLPKSIALEIELSEDLWMAMADTTQLHQILMNLCINARDAMPDGGNLLITANNCRVDELDSRLDAQPGNYVKIEVADTGSGIPSHQLDRIFDPFFTTKDVGCGTGLGLSAVLGIVKSHGGFVDVQSKLQEGSRFQIHLPACHSMEPSILDRIALPVGEQQTILVVDDEAAIRDLLKVTLESYNYRALIAPDSNVAIQIYRQYQAEIDLVLVDVMMPAIDGFATIAALQQINPHLQAMMMSGLISTEIKAQARQLGCRSILAKPFTTQEFLRALHQNLSWSLEKSAGGN
jgi:two-component system, cell cycle sensor histidine kinase and response regulator CckA